MPEQFEDCRRPGSSGEDMAPNKISRNAPCPCGSGKKFKHCCIGKDIDWQARQAAPPRRPIPLPSPRPRTSPSPDFAVLGPFRIVDARLKEIARATPDSADWKVAVERLSDTTPDDERMATSKMVRDAGVLPPDAALFLFGHAIQWMTSEETDLDRHTLASLRRFGLDELADLYANDRLEFDRQHERGRQFFFGPPDEMLAQGLREKGIID
jgi:hypothetical protein